MKFEKVALKMRWKTPLVRQIAVNEELLRKVEAKNPVFAAHLRQASADIH